MILVNRVSIESRLHGIVTQPPNGARRMVKCSAGEGHSGGLKCPTLSIPNPATRGRSKKCRSAPALSRPYRRSPPTFALSFRRRSGNRRHKKCTRYPLTWRSVDRRPNPQCYTATPCTAPWTEMPSMTCSFCDQPLISALERTRGVCASCHVLSRQSGNQRAGGDSANTPPPRISPGEVLDITAAPPTPLANQTLAQDDVPARDNNASNTSAETGLRR